MELYCTNVAVKRCRAGIRLCMLLMILRLSDISAQFDGFFDTPGRVVEPPTSSPTQFEGLSLQLSQSSYEMGEDITVSFQYGTSRNPQPRDFIGLFPTHRNPNQHAPDTFLFLCQQQTPCEFAASDQGEVHFGDNTVALEAQLASWKWPLEQGDYRAFLLRGTRTPFVSLAQSSVFTIRPDFHTGVIVPAVQAIEQEIRNLIRRDETMGPKFVRLGFHDCTGGCDGCVDLTFHDNAGLEVPMDALRPIVARHENPELGISRADIWALAAHVAADVAQARSNTKFDYHLEFIGRRNCESGRSTCFDMDNNPRACSETLGPHVHLPPADTTTEALFHFFFEEFGFDVEETVALMGAHTLGSLSKFHSGFDAPNGWVRDNLLLDNDYYHELVGGQSREAPMFQLIDGAPPWERFIVNNEDLPGTPNLPAWRAFPPAFDGNGFEEILMLNVDIAIVRELDDTNLLENGRVMCAFIEFFADRNNVPRCPHAQRSLHFAAEYKFNNDLWLHDFHKVYRKMLNHGYAYTPDQQCPGNLCVYDDEVDFGAFFGNS